MSETAHIILEARNLSKTYPNGVQAVKDVSFDLYRGEIHAIVGENGAGKSTIMKMLYGLETPSNGRIFINGKAVDIRSPQDAINLNIGLVHQHFMLVESLSVAENITLGQEHVKGPFLDHATMQAETLSLAEHYGMSLDPKAQVESLAVGLKQRIEILKALYKGAKILLLDEPTAVLTPQETESLFTAIRQLVKHGMTVIFITHKLAEVKAVADRITIMCDGHITGRVHASKVTESKIAEMMVGRPISYTPAPRQNPNVKPLIEVKNLTVISSTGRIRLNSIALHIRPGEILGIAGVEGNGQAALGQALIGLVHPVLGQGSINGNLFTGQGVAHARSHGIANIPEDRIYNGIAKALSIEDNFIASQYQKPPYSSAIGLQNLKEIHKSTRSMIANFEVKAQSTKDPIGMLSGGNMQKIVVGRELANNPRFLIAAQPTRGVDIGAGERLPPASHQFTR